MNRTTEYRECQAFCPVVRIGSPHPLSARECYPPLVPGGQTCLRESGWEEPIWTKGRTSWYSSCDIITLRTEPMRHKMPKMPKCLSPHPNWDHPTPSLIVIRNCAPPSEPKEEGTHSPADEVVGWSPFGRLEKKTGTLYSVLWRTLTMTTFILCGDLNHNCACWPVSNSLKQKNCSGH
jgi:hypothetical protein